MKDDEIEVPKEIRQFMLEDAEETHLGKKNNAIRQFRYGNLHIREYKDKFLLHTDKVDPRKDPLGHLIKDAPEFLVGMISTLAGGIYSKKILKMDNIKNKNDNKNIPISSILVSLACGYMGYSITKKIKEGKWDVDKPNY